MKSFRHIVIVPVLLVILAVISGMTIGCKSKCGSTTCQNGGDCESNVCVCPIGYSGASCQNSWSGAAVGTYTCSNASCTPAISSVASWQSIVTVDATNGGYTIDISNFDGNNTTVVATIDSSENGISRISIVNSAGVNAMGSYDSTIHKINLQYTVYEGGTTPYSCSMVMSKIP